LAGLFASQTGVSRRRGHGTVRRAIDKSAGRYRRHSSQDLVNCGEDECRPTLAKNRYGDEVRPGDAHVIWRRIGDHSIFADP
jgi:hypothetical protein